MGIDPGLQTQWRRLRFGVSNGSRGFVLGVNQQTGLNGCRPCSNVTQKSVFLPKRGILFT
jgi:hypothetical protein